MKTDGQVYSKHERTPDIYPKARQVSKINLKKKKGKQTNHNKTQQMNVGLMPDLAARA